jgi:hypothetical protein
MPPFKSKGGAYGVVFVARGNKDTPPPRGVHLATALSHAAKAAAFCNSCPAALQRSVTLPERMPQVAPAEESSMQERSSFARQFKIAAAACGALAVVGCATVNGPPPTAELAVANAAISDAVGAGGPEYAGAEFRNAQRKFDRAQDAMALGDNVAARQLAEEAEVDARLAATRARSAKAVHAAAEVQASIRALREEIDRAH